MFTGQRSLKAGPSSIPGHVRRQARVSPLCAGITKYLITLLGTCDLGSHSDSGRMGVVCKLKRGLSVAVATFGISVMGQRR